MRFDRTHYVFSGVKSKFKPLDNSECSSEKSEYDKLTTVLLEFSAKFEPGLGLPVSNFLTGHFVVNSYVF